MKILCVGGGPAGLYFAISMKLRDPAHEIVVIERNKPGDTFGWGVVFSDQTLENLQRNDPVSAETIAESFAHWDDIDTFIHGEKVSSSGHGFIGIGRKRLLNILQDRARELGVDLRFEQEFGPDNLADWGDRDLIVASDGVNSKIRERYAADFEPDIDVRTNKYVWLGSDWKLDAFTFLFERTRHGWVWAHAYQFDADTSTFIVECSEETWRAAGFDRMSGDETIAACREIFGRHLKGATLMSNMRHLRGSAWLNFNRVSCARYHVGNLALMGDAAHTAHFSIGSGTKLALEDAIDLAERLDENPVDAALAEYSDARRLEVLKLQSAARNSTEWFESIDRYAQFDPVRFRYSLLTRSQRFNHEKLRQSETK